MLAQSVTWLHHAGEVLRHVDRAGRHVHARPRGCGLPVSSSLQNRRIKLYLLERVMIVM